MIIVGKPSNNKIVKYLYEYLKREIETLSYKYTGSFKNNFCHGAVSEISQKLKAQHETTAPQDTSRALVTQWDREVEKAFKDFSPHTRKSSARIGGGDGYGDGRNAGRGIGIRAGVEGGNGRKVFQLTA